MAEEQVLSLPRGRMLCLTFGAGPRPLVIITGIRLSSIHGMGRTMEKTYSRLIPGHTVYVLDRIEPLPEGYTVLQMAEDIAQAMQLLGITEADIFGHSQGGMIAQLLAAEHPGLVHAMVLAATAGTGAQIPVLRHWQELADSVRIPELNRNIYAHAYPPAFLEKHRRALETMARMGTPEQCRRFGILARAALEFDGRAALPQIRCPVLVIGDRDDRVIAPDAIRALSDSLGCEAVLYEGFGHNVCELSPECRQRIADYFDRHSN